MSSPTAVKAAIKTVLETVTEIQRVYDNTPNSLPPSDLPAAVIYIGEATYRDGGNFAGETRTYTINVYVAPAKQGVPGEVEARCETLFSPMRAAFPVGARLNRLNGVLKAQLTGDKGVTLMELLGGSLYVGVQFSLEVQQ